MAGNPPDPAVRELTLEMESDAGPPRFGVGLALLIVGALIGWGAAAFGNASTVPSTTRAPQLNASSSEILVPRDTRPAPTVTWTHAEDLPGIPPGFEYAGTSNIVELNGAIFVIVNFKDPVSERERSQIWQSADGVEWVAEDLDIGEAVTGLHLTTDDSSLLVTARSNDALFLLRSIPGRAIGGSSWTAVSLHGSDVVALNAAATSISDEGNLITVAVGNFDIWRRVIDPLLPPDVDLDDPGYVFRTDGALFLTRTEDGVDYAEVVPLLAETPEVVATKDTIWIRLVTDEGEEILQTVPVPGGAYPNITNPPLTGIQLTQAWISDDGFDFLQVTGPRSLPDGLLLHPHSWDGGFLAPASQTGGSFAVSDRLTLLSSSSGRAWRLDEEQPPAVCSSASVAFGAGRIHLTAEDGTQCVRAVDTSWEVLPERLDAALVAGGKAGFIAYPNSFEYDSGFLSRDGITWTDISIPGFAPYPTLAILRDRVVAFSVDKPRPDRPAVMGIWVGEISG